MTPGIRFLELSVPAGDVRESLDFYRQLGFTELTTNDVRPYAYAVVTDGVVALGLHGAQLGEPALAFVGSGVAHRARQLRSQGRDLAFARLADDQFNEFGLRSPDGHLLLMVEARTFSPGGAADALEPLIGRAREIALRSRDLGAGREFWRIAGLEPVREPAAGDEVLDLRSSGLVLSLGRTLSWPGPVLRYPAPGREALAILESRGIEPRRQDAARVLTAPEGTLLLLDAPG